METELRQHLGALDAAAIRADFPLLNQPVEIGQQPLAYLDSAASSQKPAVVIEAVDDYYRRYNANIHRGAYRISEMATAKYEEARHILASFLNAKSADECVFVRNTTEGINLVAQSWGRKNLKEGDLIVLTKLEHHSNIVPWQLLAEEKGLRIEFVPLTSDQQLDLDAYRDLLGHGPKLVGAAHVSNGVGTINDVATITKLAHEIGAVVVIDGAQGAPHLAVDVQAIDCDFYALSGHKMLGPMGSGVLYGKKALLNAMPPFMGGGGMIKKVTLEGSTYLDAPARFEAGTPAVGEAIGLAVAAEYLSALGMENVRAHEIEITDYALERLPTVPHLRLYGPLDANLRGGVISFTLGEIHPHDVAAILDTEQVAVRAGQHCNQPLMREIDAAATTRASFYIYNTPHDVDRLIAALHKANAVFGQ
jgi:cysteine desulfurase/selenocysteine lyase